MRSAIRRRDRSRTWACVRDAAFSAIAVVGAAVAALAAATTPGSPPTPPEPGLPGLAAAIATTIGGWFPMNAGSVTRVEGERVWVDLGRLDPGAVLEWQALDAPFTHPASLDLAGTVLRRCGEIRIDGSDGSQSRGVWTGTECPPPAPGDRVHVPGRPLELAVIAGNAEPALAGLVDLLVDVVPGRLERSGRFTVRSTGQGAGAAASDDPGALARAAGLDAVAALHAARRDARLIVLVELAATRPRARREIAQIEIPSPPEALWRDRVRGTGSPYGRGSAAVPGRILALAAMIDGDTAPGVVVLTDERLDVARLAADGRLVLDPVADFRSLRRLPSRSPSGSVTVIRDPATTTICFAATVLAGAWCRPAGVEFAAPLRPLGGVPFASPAHGLVLAAYAPDTNLLTGIVRDTQGRQIADIGQFTALAPAAVGGLMVSRPSGRLERLTASFEPTDGPGEVTGDAWAEVSSALRVESAARVPGEPDELTWIKNGVTVHRTPVSGNVAALVAVDIDGDGPVELAVATTDPGGPSRLSLFSIP